jgi:hypothetical protein
MNLEESRLILDRGFERAVQTVVEVFALEGFRVAPVDTGYRHRRTEPGTPARYALLEATLPELTFRPARITQTPALFGCRVSLFELTGACTMVTVERPVVSYPRLASLVPRIADRVGQAVRSLTRSQRSSAA